MELFFVTSNKNKLREFEEILGINLNHVHIDLDELQELDADKIAEHKARQAFDKLKKPVIVTDESVYMDCLNGFPGPLVKWFRETVTSQKICRIAHALGNNKAQAKTTITFFDGTHMKHFYGVVAGTIADSPRGNLGFGWDDIFIPEGESKTFSEMTSKEKHAVSMRAKAIESFKPYLEQIMH